MMDEVLQHNLLDAFQQGRHDMTNNIFARDLSLYKALYSREGHQLFGLRIERYEE